MIGQHSVLTFTVSAASRFGASTPREDLDKVGSILNLSPLAKQSCGEVGKFDKSKSYSYVIKDAPTRRLA